MLATAPPQDTQDTQPTISPETGSQHDPPYYTPGGGLSLSGRSKGLIR